MKPKTMILVGAGLLLLYEYMKNNPNTFGGSILSSIPGMHGLGRTYVSGMGTIGAGYNINAQHGGDASAYEMASKFHL